MGFLFYDTETTGLSTEFDQILQFAAVETDDDFNEVSTLDLRCRILPYVVPAPKALLVTGVRPSDLVSPNRSHYEMMTEVRSWISARTPTTVIGHNSIKFDEGMLRQAFYQTLRPVYLTNTGGNARADTMRMAQAAAIFAPSSLIVPTTDGGKASFKLGPLARANGIEFDEKDAHEALADVRATIELARLLRSNAPEVWTRMLANGRKAGALEFIARNRAFCLGEAYFGKLYSWLVAPIARNPERDAEHAVFDLAYDPIQFLDFDVEGLVEVMNGKEKAIRVVAANAQPMLADTTMGAALVEASGLDRDVLRERVRLIQGDGDFRKRVETALTARRSEEEEPEHVEQRVHGGFPRGADATLMEAFHAAGPEERAAICARFEDLRYVELGRRLLYVEAPGALTPDESREIADAFAGRLLSEEEEPWLTIPKALVDLAKLAEEGGDPGRLEEIRRYLEDMRDRFATNGR